MDYRTAQVADLAHVSVRTLHHYDRIGLLVPAKRSPAGYRAYDAADLERLQQILFYRELGLGLREIRALMTDPTFDRLEALAAQRRAVAVRVQRLEAMLALIDQTLASPEGGTPMTTEEMFSVFGDFDPSAHEEEVQERWGNTEAHRESQRRTRAYSAEDWRRYKIESEASGALIAALMDEGVAADDPRALDAAEGARLLIDRWFYPCSRTQHAALGEMYVADPRFAANYEKIRPGMAEYLRAATAANLARGEA
ncbi:MAG: MerR family transcriptional regulator [Thermoleophilia bacterium]